MKQNKTLIFVLIFLLGIFLRVWKLPQFPIQLNHDEITQVYDAISIAQTARDIYGNFLPTIFQSVGDYKPPFYTYATSLVYLIVGNHEWTIRVVGVIFGILIIPGVFWFTIKLTKQVALALFASFFIAISPSEIFFSRKSFESGAGIFFLLISFSCFLTFFEKQEQKWLYFGLVSSTFGMYTYFSHAIIIPLMLIAFIFIFRERFVQLKKKFLPFIILFIILILPLLVIIFTNPGARFRSQTVFITADRSLGEYLKYSNFPIKTLFDFSFNRYLEQFNPLFLFGNGLDLTNQGPINSGPLLLIQLPLILIAIFYFLKNRNLTKESKLLTALIILGTLPSGITFEPHSPHRMAIVFTIFNIISGIGAFFLWQKINNFKKQYRFTSILVLLVLVIINVIYFLNIYFVNYPYEKSQYLHYPFKEVSKFAWSKYYDFDTIVFDPMFGEDAPFIGTAAHYYLAYYGNYPPSRFQKEYRVGSKERETIFDKFSIRKVDWRQDKDLKDTLIIASPWEIPIDKIDKSKIIKEFNFYDGKVAFYALKM